MKMPNLEDRVQVCIAAAFLAEDLVFDSRLIDQEPPAGRTRLWHLTFTIPAEGGDLPNTQVQVYVVGKTDLVGAFTQLRKQAFIRAEFPVDPQSSEPITLQTVAAAYRSVVTATSVLLGRFPGRFELVDRINSLPWMRISSKPLSEAPTETAASNR